MNLCNIGQNFKYELEKLIRIFLPFEKITFFDTETPADRMAVVTRMPKGEIVNLSATVLLDGKKAAYSTELPQDTDDYEKTCERLLAIQLYRCFVELTGNVPQWGILTGVRPAKLDGRLRETLGEAETDRYFSEELMVDAHKISLCKEATAGEDAITSLSRPDSFSLYISVPFCPTRCHYCSFVSHSVAQAKKLIPQYVELLCREIRATAEIARKKHLHLETVYIGGGTPTTLSAEQLTAVMNTVRENFDLSDLREYTVEAGRPDTFTPGRMTAIKNGGATRISINPQTMQDAVLQEIGRKHTAKQTVEAFRMARQCGFHNVNMDLIAGLPGDTFESFCDTLQQVLALDPESVTVHSLSMKRASTLTADGRLPETQTALLAAKMVDYARKTLTENGIAPYYMYRQSKTVGNLENVGYAKKGFEGLYNVYIMDETHTILACGASAVTKLRQPDGDYISRIFNFKYPYEYIARFDEQLQRKEGIDAFYEEYPIPNQ
ncbi:MAG: coproporphyrinogen dehydrogenase HemZ [Clostridia bacterium]|nr:coproporphyrinogen dehydrogenase HemZ [Clostridia bacterium]